MNRELRQSMMVISAGKRMLVDALEQAQPRLGGRLYHDGNIISAHKKGYNSSRTAFKAPPSHSPPFDLDRANGRIRLAYAPVGRDILFNGRSIYSASPPTIPLEPRWFFARCSYSGEGLTAVNRHDPEVEPGEDGICSFPTWVNLGRLASTVEIIDTAPGVVPGDVFCPFEDDTFEASQWVRTKTVWGIASFGEQPDSCPEPGTQMVQAPATVEVTALLGSVYQDADENWQIDTFRLRYNGGGFYIPSPSTINSNVGFSPYVQVLLSKDGWGAA
jgi:hypothetical protein